MPIYGSFRYGTRLYGPSPRVSSLSSMSARVVDYGKVQVSVYAESRVGVGYSIVRTKNGAAESPSSGVTIKSGTVGESVVSVIDGLDNFEDNFDINDVGVPSGPVYYTFFVYDSFGNWAKDAATSIIAPDNLGGTSKIVWHLPRVYTSPMLSPTDEIDFDSDLSRFLYGFGVTLDEVQSAISRILPASARGRTTIRGLHESLARSVGMPVEYTIGVDASSRLFHNAGLIYRNKGTAKGVIQYVEALTGWDSAIEVSPNKLLSVDDASFESSTGMWGAEGATLTVQAPGSASVTAPVSDYDYTLSPFVALGIGEVVLTDASAALTLPTLDPLETSPTSFSTNRDTRIRTNSVPVNEGGDYFLSLHLRPIVVGTSLTMEFQIDWYDQYSEFVSTSTHADEVTMTGSDDWSRIVRSFTAPTGAAYAVIRFALSGEVDDVLHLDRVQFSATDIHYHDPQTVDIVCGPRRINLLTRPSFEGDTSWTGEEGTTVAVTTDEHLVGSYALEMTGTDFIALSESVLAAPSNLMRFAGYFKGDPCSVSVIFFDSNGDPVEASEPSITTDINKPYVTEGAGDWERVDLQALTPSNAATMKVQVSGSGTTYMDLAILERTDDVQVYFDSTIGDAAGEDVMITTTASGSILALLYPNRLTKLSRLKSTIPFYLPVGVASRILLWDSTDPDVHALIPYGT